MGDFVHVFDIFLEAGGSGSKGRALVWQLEGCWFDRRLCVELSLNKTPAPDDLAVTLCGV